MKNSADLGFVHRFEPAAKPGLRPLLLLHGTGGDENDLLSLGQRLLPGAALLSPRGKVLENGMPRFFRRLAEGVFDLEDLAARTAELADFVAKARDAYALPEPIALGCSNGANIAASLLLTRPEALAGAVLLRATLPLEPKALPPLAGTPVLLLSGAVDPFAPAQKRDQLARLLRDAGADLTHEILPGGHGLTPDHLVIAGRWLASHAVAG